MANPTNYSKTNPSASGYTRTTPNATQHSLVNIETGALLLETGDYLLLENGDNLLLEQSQTQATNYTAEATP